MPTEVLATPRAEQQISGLTRKQAKTFDNFLNELAADGCRALAYRLSGNPPVDRSASSIAGAATPSIVRSGGPPATISHAVAGR
jgi:hypothetical protein